MRDRAGTAARDEAARNAADSLVGDDQAERNHTIRGDSGYTQAQGSNGRETVGNDRDRNGLLYGSRP